MPSNLKILHVIPSVSPARGGPSKAIIEMVYALRKLDVNAEVATTNDDGRNTLDVPLNQKIEHQGIPLRFFKRFSPNINAVREFAYSHDFKSWLKQHITDYDVIHIHAIFSFCSTYAMTQARKHNVPYIVRPIGQLENWSLTQSNLKKKCYLWLIEQKNLQKAAALHFTAEPEKKQASHVIPNLKSHVIPLGINPHPLIPDANKKMVSRWELKQGIPTLLFLSRLHPKKGLELLLDSLTQLHELDDTFKFQLVIAGSGEANYVESLKAKVHQIGLQNQCYFIGFVEGPEKELLLQGSDLFALTSHSENFGIAALEAMCSGTAVLISQDVALSQVVNEHELGYTTNLTTDSICKALTTALAQLDKNQTMGDTARAFVKQHYQWPVISKKIKNLYIDISIKHSNH